MRAFLDDAAGRAWAKLRPLRNRRFESRLRHDAGAPALLLSPHLDDAVIDCWSLLTGPGEVRVVNVFAGVPPPGVLAYFDRLAGARDSASHMRHRIAEDHEALGRAGRSPVNLGFLARSYRGARPEPSFARIDAAVASRAVAASVVYAPAALGAGHPDHDLVREYALRLRLSGLPVRLYADLPYCAVYGWPAWVTGREPYAHLDIDAYWNGSSLPLGPGSADVARLGDEESEAKLAAMRSYREFAVLDRGPVGQLRNREIHGFEVFWRVPEAGARP